MLQAMRGKAAGIVVKILFSLLVLAFAFWGVGDYSFLRRDDPTVVKVGDVSIPQSRLEREYRQEIDRLRRSLGQLDPEIMRQFGLANQVVDRMVNQTLFDKAAERLGVRIGDDAVRSRLFSMPELQGPTGFDRVRFQQLLQDNSLTEAGFVQLYRQDIARGMVVDALSSGARAPDAMVELLYRYRNEKRGGEAVFVASSSMTDIAKPADADLQALYDENRDRFTSPEYRALTIVRVSAEELLDKIQIDDAQLEDEYRARLPEMSTPERRTVDQLLFGDEAAAKAAADSLTGGKAFADVARDVNQPPEQTALGEITRGDLFPDLADAVFKLPLNGASAPLKSAFGWHVFRVTRIEPGREPALAEVKDRLLHDLKQRSAADDAYQHATTAEDALANGDTLEAAAAKTGVPAVKVASVDARGRDLAGAAVPLLDGANDAIVAAFETASGRTSQLVEGRPDSWYLIRVDGVTPSTLKPLADVRDQIVSVWEAQKRDEAARARAQVILDGVVGGKTLEAAASAFSLKTSPVPNSLRTVSAIDASAPVPPEVISRLFALKPNESALVSSQGGVYVARLTQVEAADPAADANGVAQLRAQLRQQIGSDLVGEYVQSLRQRYGVTIDQKAIDGLL